MPARAPHQMPQTQQSGPAAGATAQAVGAAAPLSSLLWSVQQVVSRIWGHKALPGTASLRGAGQAQIEWHGSTMWVELL